MLLTHYANFENLRAIWKSRILQSAFSLMTKEEKKCHAGEVRTAPLSLSLALLRNHNFANGEMPPGYSGHLDKHVFFWANTAAGERYRLSFRKTYPEDVGLWCCLDDLRAANPGVSILWSRNNSGTNPRSGLKCNLENCGGSLNLFKPWPSQTGQVVEVVIPEKVHMPRNTMCERDGELRRFFTRKFPFQSEI